MNLKQRLTAIKNNLTSILGAVNTQLVNKGASAVPELDDVATAIGTIPTGITPTGQIVIEQNGTYNVTDFASAAVSVIDGRISPNINIGLFTPDVDSLQYSVTHTLGRVPTGAIVFDANGDTFETIPLSGIVMEYLIPYENKLYSYVYDAFFNSQTEKKDLRRVAVANATYPPSYDESQVTFATSLYYQAKFKAGRTYQYIIY